MLSIINTNNKFFFLTGRNGAIYIVNVSSFSAIKISLGFYQAKNLNQNILKTALLYWLFFISIFNRLIQLPWLTDSDNVASYLKSLGCKTKLNVTNSTSILISPTRDKIIINEGGIHFQKIAFGNSYNKVANELAIYKLLNEKPSYFAYSEVYDFFDDGISVCSFKMKAPQVAIDKNFNIRKLSAPLAEFFKEGKPNITVISQVVSTFDHLITDDLLGGTLIYKVCIGKLKYHSSRYITLGLVHGDFKHWNMIASNPILIFDFEEAKLSGLPLEDLFNFIIDPIVRYQPAAKVTDIVFSNDIILVYQDYLARLDIDLDFKILLYVYLLGRIAFWHAAGEVSTARAYLVLLSFIDKSEYALSAK